VRQNGLTAVVIPIGDGVTLVQKLSEPTG